MNKFCKDCRFWERVKFCETDLGVDESDVGLCKRYPPKILFSYATTAAFPKTKALEKECGEFEEKNVLID